MIYLDSAATSLLKPRSVGRAMTEALRCCASPGRGSHAAAMRAAEIALACREAAAELFHVEDPAQVVFTMNATHALNLAIHSLLRPGDRAVISGYEHNAVTRPLHALGAQIVTAWAPLFDRNATLAAFDRAMDGADVVIINHVSNVFGFIQPLEEVAALCSARRIPLIVDASQSAGVLPLDFSALGCEYMAMPGHKGLLGPQGTGLLLCREGASPLLYGGTGSLSREQSMPPFLPDRLEAGTHNIPGIAGLLEGIRYIMAAGTEQIDAHERRMLAIFSERLTELGVSGQFLAEDRSAQAGVLSVCPHGLECEAATEALGSAGVAVRSGLHCAPLAHASAGTLDTGTVRFSFSPFHSPEEMTAAAEISGKILGNGNKL